MGSFSAGKAKASLSVISEKEMCIRDRECTEVIIGGRKEDREETIYEIADLTYHVMVLMVQMGITLEDVTAELEKRHVIDHKVKQERMQ